MAGNDFVNVQLTPAGVALAGGHPLTVQNGRAHYSFAPGSPVRVLTSELKTWLSQQHTSKGDPIFEIVPAPPTVIIPIAEPKA